MAEEEKEICPYCDALYHPQWVSSTSTSPHPRRNEPPIYFGAIKVSTCTSCDRLLVKIFPGGDYEKVQLREAPRYLLPAEPEVVIEIVIQLFVDFENARRNDKGEAKMTAEEEQSQRQRWTQTLDAMYEVVRKGGDMARLARPFLPFFE